MMLYWLSIIAGLISAAGCCYIVVATLLTDRFARQSSSPRCGSAPGVTILKPLHGLQPSLFDSLASFCVQDYDGPVQIVFGVQDPNDEAIAVVERLRTQYDALQFDLVIDTSMHGLNRKVSNLINMARRIEHDIVIVADDDMQVMPDYLSSLVAELEHSGAGAVTCLYHGITEGGIWARLAALGINAHFLPSIIVGLALDLAHPCLGSTIALKRKTLGEIGGFLAVADCLADDYAIGAALRARGHTIAVMPTTVAHACGEMSARDWWHHEVRWARTIRSIDPAGYAGSFVTHAFPLALVGTFAGFAAGALAPIAAAMICMATLGARLALLRQVERAFTLPPQSYWLVPLRDVLSFIIFVASSFGRNAGWKGRRYTFAAGGTLVVARAIARSSPRT